MFLQKSYFHIFKEFKLYIRGGRRKLFQQKVKKKNQISQKRMKFKGDFVNIDDFFFSFTIYV